MPTKVERKVIGLGHNTLLVTLPVAWTRYHSVKRGDRLVIITNHELRIYPAKKQIGSNVKRKVSNGET